MTSLLSVLLGGGAGLGAFIVLRALLQKRTIDLAELGNVLSATETPVSRLGVDNSTTKADLTGVQARLGRLGVGILNAIGLTDVARLRDQLRVLDKSIERHAYEKMLGAVVGFSLPLLMVLVLAIGGVEVPVLWLFLLGLVLSIAGFFYPDLPLTERVEKRRRAFRHAFSSYLDLVTIMLAGGAGTESALQGAAEAGEGWAFAELRQALRRAEAMRRSPWEVFDELGIELGVSELQELAASVSLAGNQGAKVKQSLSAKAEAMRIAQAAELEAASESQTEKMIMPVTVLIVGLVLFIGYGAMEAISGGGSEQFDQQVEFQVEPPTPSDQPAPTPQGGG